MTEDAKKYFNSMQNHEDYQGKIHLQDGSTEFRSGTKNSLELNISDLDFDISIISSTYFSGSPYYTNTNGKKTKNLHLEKKNNFVITISGKPFFESTTLLPLDNEHDDLTKRKNMDEILKGVITCHILDKIVPKSEKSLEELLKMSIPRLTKERDKLAQSAHNLYTSAYDTTALLACLTDEEREDKEQKSHPLDKSFQETLDELYGKGRYNLDEILEKAYQDAKVKEQEILEKTKKKRQKKDRAKGVVKIIAKPVITLAKGVKTIAAKISDYKIAKAQEKEQKMKEEEKQNLIQSLTDEELSLIHI